MKNLISKILFLVGLLLSIFDLQAKIIYVEPVQNAKYVSINNNVIIGFDDMIENSDLSSLIKVTGSLSGIHTGEIILTSDKKKLIFKPHQAFAFNEQIEVKLNRIKTSFKPSNSLTYTFQTQTSKPEWDQKKNLMYGIENSSYTGYNNNTNSLNLPPITVNISNNPTKGDLYLSNFYFPIVPNTSYLIETNNRGIISYFREVDIWAFDYKKQPNGSLTYYLGDKFYAENIQHIVIDSFECGNGYSTDQHELQIISNGHALLMSYDTQTVDMSKIVIGGNPNATVIGLIIQEIDENKNVVFQWRSWDHFAITDAEHEILTAARIDYVHGNAIELDYDGNLMISSRHLSEITKINRTTGNIIWRLGGVNNQFDFSNDPIGFSYQHDIRRIPNGNITLFDNGNFHSPQFSRAVEYQIDEINKIVTLVWQYRKNPDIYSLAMGSMQRLHNGNTLIGWGWINPTITEVTPAGDIALEMSMPQNMYSYRVFRDEVNLTLNIKLAIEGFYNSQINRLNMKDTVRAHVRSINSPYNVIDSSKSVIDSVNLEGNFRYYNVNSGTYYISIKHRNGLETWSKAGGESFLSGGVYFYGFINSNSQAYGNNLILKGSKYCIYSGDVNQDGFIDIADAGLIESDELIFATGYLASDLNGDGFVDFSDAVIADNNGFNFVRSITP
ncbi:MAG: aryl-sulfate sulfotransferase [Bacteroidota bacterium]|nr:aryl-sulfate sulfotransferase [Bacteroidota bacterium]